MEWNIKCWLKLNIIVGTYQSCYSYFNGALNLLHTALSSLHAIGTFFKRWQLKRGHRVLGQEIQFCYVFRSKMQYHTTRFKKKSNNAKRYQAHVLACLRCLHADVYSTKCMIIEHATRFTMHKNGMHFVDYFAVVAVYLR